MSTDSPDEVNSIVQKLHLNLKHLENRYTNFVSHCATLLTRSNLDNEIQDARFRLDKQIVDQLNSEGKKSVYCKVNDKILEAQEKVTLLFQGYKRDPQLKSSVARIFRELSEELLENLLKLDKQEERSRKVKGLLEKRKELDTNYEKGLQLQIKKIQDQNKDLKSQIGRLKKFKKPSIEVSSPRSSYGGPLDSCETRTSMPFSPRISSPLEQIKDYLSMFLDDVTLNIEDQYYETFQYRKLQLLKKLEKLKTLGSFNNEEEVSKLKAQLNKANSDIDYYYFHLKTKDEQLEDYSKQVEKLNAAIYSYSQQLENLESQVSEKNEKIQKLKQTQGHQTGEISQNLKKLDKVIQELQECRRENESLSKKMTEYRAKVELAYEEWRISDNKRQTLQKELNYYQNYCSEVKKWVSQTVSSISETLQSKLSHVQTLLEEKESYLSQVEKKVSTLNSIEDKNQILNTQLTQVKGEWDKVTSSLNEMSGAVKQLLEDKQELYKVQEQYEKQLQEKTNQLLTLENQLQKETEKSKNYYEKCEFEIKTVKEYNERIDSEYVALRDSYQNLEKTHNSILLEKDKQYNELVKENQRLNKELEKVSVLKDSEFSEIQKFIEDLRRQISEANKEKDCKIDELEANIEALKSERNRLYNEKQEIYQNYIDTNKSLEILSTDYQRSRESNQKYSELLQTAQKTISELQGNTYSTEKTFRQVQEELEKLHSDKATYEDKLKQLESLLAEKDTKMKDLETENKERYSELEKELMIDRENYVELQQNNDKLKKQVNNLKEELSKAKKASESLKPTEEAKQALENQVNELKKTAQEKQNLANKHKKEKVELISKVSAQEKKLSEASEKETELSKKVTELQEKLIKYQKPKIVSQRNQSINNKLSQDLKASKLREENLSASLKEAKEKETTMNKQITELTTKARNMTSAIKKLREENKALKGNLENSEKKCQEISLDVAKKIEDLQESHNSEVEKIQKDQTEVSKLEEALSSLEMLKMQNQELVEYLESIKNEKDEMQQKFCQEESKYQELIQQKDSEIEKMKKNRAQIKESYEQLSQTMKDADKHRLEKEDLKKQLNSKETEIQQLQREIQEIQSFKDQKLSFENQTQEDQERIKTLEAINEKCEEEKLELLENNRFLEKDLGETRLVLKQLKSSYDELRQSNLEKDELLSELKARNSLEFYESPGGLKKLASELGEEDIDSMHEKIIEIKIERDDYYRELQEVNDILDELKELLGEQSNSSIFETVVKLKQKSQSYLENTNLLKSHFEEAVKKVSNFISEKLNIVESNLEKLTGKLQSIKNLNTQEANPQEIKEKLDSILKAYQIQTANKNSEIEKYQVLLKKIAEELETEFLGDYLSVIQSLKSQLYEDSEELREEQRTNFLHQEQIKLLKDTIQQIRTNLQKLLEKLGSEDSEVQNLILETMQL